MDFPLPLQHVGLGRKWGQSSGIIHTTGLFRHSETGHSPPTVTKMLERYLSRTHARTQSVIAKLGRKMTE